MKIRCPNCRAKIDRKSQYCQFCAYELFSKEERQNTQVPTDYNSLSKTCFVTSGDIFKIGDDTVLIGIAVQKMSVGDVLNFNGNDLVIDGIDLFKKRNVDYVEKGNCALRFCSIDFERFKMDIERACENSSSTNQPINFGTKPTTKYTFIDLK